MQVGQRVKLSAAGAAQFKHSRKRLNTGTVVGNGRDKNEVRVRHDGLKTAYTYSVRFWEPIENV